MHERVAPDLAFAVVFHRHRPHVQHVVGQAAHRLDARHQHHLLTQGGRGEVALTQQDIRGPSEGFRQAIDYYAHAPQTGAVLRRLARQQPKTLACMHGSAWQGDGAALLRQLAQALQAR